MRLRGHYPTSNSIRATHLDFIQKSQLNRREVSSPALYRKIIEVLFSKIFKAILYDGYVFRYKKLGQFLAVMFYPSVREEEDGRIVTNKPINYPATYKLRRETGDKTLKVYFDNEDTGGLIYRIIWDTSRVHFTNKSFYSFSLNRTIRGLFSKEAKAGNIMATLVNFKI